jgi:hypothetical protein
MTLEFNLKMLAEVINIYYLLRNLGMDCTAHQMLRLKENIMQIYSNLGNIIRLMRNVQSKPFGFSNG